jgi:hypothetical protein
MKILLCEFSSGDNHNKSSGAQLSSHPASVWLQTDILILRLLYFNRDNKWKTSVVIIITGRSWAIYSPYLLHTFWKGSHYFLQLCDEKQKRKKKKNTYKIFGRKTWRYDNLGDLCGSEWWPVEDAREHCSSVVFRLGASGGRSWTLQFSSVQVRGQWRTLVNTAVQ